MAWVEGIFVRVEEDGVGKVGFKRADLVDEYLVLEVGDRFQVNYGKLGSWTTIREITVKGFDIWRCSPPRGEGKINNYPVLSTSWRCNDWQIMIEEPLNESSPRIGWCARLWIEDQS